MQRPELLLFADQPEKVLEIQAIAELIWQKEIQFVDRLVLV